MAKGYVIGLVTVSDPEAYKAYAAEAERLVAAHGGRYLVRGGDREVVEGDTPYQRVVVIEFDSVAKAKEFYADPEYVEAMRIRHANSEGVMIRVAGYEPA